MRTAYPISLPFMPCAGSGPQDMLTFFRSMKAEGLVGTADGTADSRKNK